LIARASDGDRTPTILGLDTTTAVTTAGILRDGRVVAERTDSLRRKDHARSLPALVESTLDEAGLTVADLDAVAVAVGPGSFTGIRLGIGFAKGIAFARGLALVGVGTLDALAEAAAEPAKPLAACLDARKGEVYLALYAPGAPPARERDVEAVPPAVAAAKIAGSLPPGGLVVGDATGIYEPEFARLSDAGLRVAPFASIHPRGGVVAVAGGRLLASGNASAAGAVAAVYVRPSAAELSLGVPR
jgi:tRNA threonylcarbamoyladenosine biosynthesis protein TsaB